MGNCILKIKSKINRNNKKKIDNEFDCFDTINLDNIIDHENSIDYCYICDDIIILGIIKHCNNCNKCHTRYKYLHCKICNFCVDPRNHFDIVLHKKKCNMYYE